MHPILHTPLSLLALTLFLFAGISAAPVPTDITSSVSQLSSPIQTDKFSPPKNLFAIHSLVEAADTDIFAVSDSLKHVGAIAARDDPARGRNNADNARKTGNTLRKGSVLIRQYGHEHDEDGTPYRGWNRDSITAGRPVDEWRRHLSGVEVERVGIKRDEGRTMSTEDWKAVFSKMTESYKQNGGDATEHMGDIRTGNLPGSVTVSKRNVEEMDSFHDEDWKVTLAKMKEAYDNYGGDATEHVGDIRKVDMPGSVVVDKRGTAGTNSFSPEEWKVVLSKMTSAYKDNHGDVSRFKGESRKGDLPGSVNVNKRKTGSAEETETFNTDEWTTILSKMTDAFKHNDGDATHHVREYRKGDLPGSVTPALPGSVNAKRDVTIYPGFNEESIPAESPLDKLIDTLSLDEKTRLGLSERGDGDTSAALAAWKARVIASKHTPPDTRNIGKNDESVDEGAAVFDNAESSFSKRQGDGIKDLQDKRDAGHPHHHYDEAEFLARILPTLKADFFASHPGAAPFGRRDAEVGDGVDWYLPEWWGNKPDGVDQTGKEKRGLLIRGL
jgi:hypothetical protein